MPFCAAHSAFDPKADMGAARFGVTNGQFSTQNVIFFSFQRSPRQGRSHEAAGSLHLSATRRSVAARSLGATAGDQV